MNETERRIRALELAIEAARNGARSCSILDDAKAFLEFISDCPRNQGWEKGPAMPYKAGIQGYPVA